jgi:menaquinone-9 beta-reductase
VTRLRDVLVVGGGPAGLAVAAAAAGRGLDVLLLERRFLPVDKACGEGLLPRAVEALDALGALRLLAPADCSPLRAIHWIDEGGAQAEARLPPPGGLGVRRLALSEALARRAREQGAELWDGTAVLEHRREADQMVARTEVGEVAARILVAADGLASPIRQREGLTGPARGPRRFGLRRHFAVAPWGDAVEVHFGRGAEAYLTPAGASRVGLAFLFQEGAAAGFDALLSRFPRLAGRLAGATADSRPLGAGPLLRSAGSRVADRLVLAGDAGGYVDAITGEGLSLAFEGALALSRLLPEALARGARCETLRPFEEAMRARYRRYAAVTRLVLSMARRPRVRRGVVIRLARHPRLFEALVRSAVG